MSADDVVRLSAKFSEKMESRVALWNEMRHPSQAGMNVLMNDGVIFTFRDSFIHFSKSQDVHSPSFKTWVEENLVEQEDLKFCRKCKSTSKCRQMPSGAFSVPYQFTVCSVCYSRLCDACSIELRETMTENCCPFCNSGGFIKSVCSLPHEVVERSVEVYERQQQQNSLFYDC